MGYAVGGLVGRAVGEFVGLDVGTLVGGLVAVAVGGLVGTEVGFAVGRLVGNFVGRGVGLTGAGVGVPSHSPKVPVKLDPKSPPTPSNTFVSPYKTVNEPVP